MDSSQKPSGQEPLPIFGSQAEAEAYTNKTGDAYFELCYHLEGRLNRCASAVHDLYAHAAPNQRPKMQTGIVREIVCPAGWPKHPQTLMAFLLTCGRFRHEETCHAHTVNEAMTALDLEKKHAGTLGNIPFDLKTFEPCTPADLANARCDLLRLCDWLESRFHYGTHCAWYRAPLSFSSDPDQSHLAHIGVAQRHLAEFSARDRKRWEGMHQRAAMEHHGDMKTWGTVGKMQHDPEPRTWTHPVVDSLIISLWPLVARHNWTYADLLKVLEKFLPPNSGGGDPCYPVDSVESLKVHCRSICGLTKTGKGKTSAGLPEGWQIAAQLLSLKGK
jgi:hypothetical protein